MNSILVTGCNRGLGLGLVKALTQLPKPPNHLFATCRNMEAATELKDLAAKNDNLHILEIDLNNLNCYDNIVKQISEITQEQGLNVLLNNAGIAPRSTRLTGCREQDMMEAFKINTVVPIMLTQACLPLLKKASKHKNDLAMSVQRAAIINMSSIMASMKGNVEGGKYGYRISKAALNSATKSMSIDLYANKILCVALHPGWVRTDMGGDKAPLDVDTSTTQMVQTILCFDESHNGGFYQYDGKQLPW